MTTTLNATTSNGLVVTPDNSGNIQLQYNGQSAPAFGAYKSAFQSLSSGAYAKITFETEEFDTNNNFASSRFTPTVAGYYQLNSCVTAESSYNTIKISIYKNGSIFKTGSNVQTNADQSSVSSLVYANGSTDYFEIYAFFSTTQSVYASSDATYFNGCLLRGA
jgi:hypothetical protein